MIHELERHLQASWHLLGAAPLPSRFHFLTLARGDDPDPGIPFLLFAFAPGARFPCAVAKVARAAAGDAAVAHEANILATLHEHLPETLVAPVPRLLHHGSTNGRAFLLMSAVAGETELHNTWGLERARPCERRIAAALDWAWGLSQSSPATVVTCADWLGDATLRDFLASAEAASWEPARREALEQRLRAAWGTTWPTALAHGDFFPGNVLFQRHALTGVVDWALASEAAPVFFDVLTYETSFAVHTARQNQGPDASLLQAVRDLAPFQNAHQHLQALGIDTGLGSPAQLATLLALHAAARVHGRMAQCRALARIVAATLDAGGSVSATPRRRRRDE